MRSSWRPETVHLLKRVVLHVGPPKTGTSILQYTLAENRERLVEQSTLYPSIRPGENSRWNPRVGDPTGVKHDYLLLLALEDPQDMLVYRRHGLTEPELTELRCECLSSLETELAGFSGDTLVLSSESFGNLAVNPTTHMAEIADYAQSLADEVVVVVYARHPIAMARSRQQQMLKSGLNTLDQLDTPWVYPYGRALEVLWRLFGRSSVHVVAYERDVNKSFDTVASFADVVGIDVTGFERPPRRGNASLSMEGALLADALAREFPQPDAMAGNQHPGRARVGWTTRIAGAPFRLSPDTEEQVMARSADDLKMLAEEYGIIFHELVDEETPLWGPEAIRSIATMINQLAKRSERAPRSAQPL